MKDKLIFHALMFSYHKILYFPAHYKFLNKETFKLNLCMQYTMKKEIGEYHKNEKDGGNTKIKHVIVYIHNKLNK